MVEIFIDIGFAFVFLFIGYYLTRALDKHHLPRIEVARQELITGKWSGVYSQEANKNKEGCELPIFMELKAGPKLITGTMIVSDRKEYEFNVEGIFYYQRYLRLNYSAAGKSKTAIDLGVLFLELDDAIEEKIIGKLAGYGSDSKTLISGSLSINKY